jgi:uncharacterized protein (TIGR02453 family)
MAYFNEAFIRFFRELSNNNDRDWFNANKKQYEKEVKDPFYHFVDDLIARVNAVNPEIVLEPKQAIFRIYRDVRFSKDKSPYKTQTSALIARGGRKNMTDPGLYIQFSAEDARIYSGLYMLEKNDLTNVRRHIAAFSDEFSTLIGEKDFVSKFGEIRGEKNKILPAEFKPELEKQPLIANKQFYYFASYEPEFILKDHLLDEIMEHYHIVQPLNRFFSEALHGV